MGDKFPGKKKLPVIGQLNLSKTVLNSNFLIISSCLDLIRFCSLSAFLFKIMLLYG